MKRFVLAVVLVVVAFPHLADAHAFRPGELEIEHLRAGSYAVSWTLPDVRRGPASALRGADAVRPELLASCERTTPRRVRSTERSRVESWRVDCDGALAERRVRISEFPRGLSTVIVRFEGRDGAATSTVASPHRRTVRLGSAGPATGEDPRRAGAQRGFFAVVARYLRLGVLHILKGIDHLLFILCLLLLVREPRRLVWTLTAFTAAHSLTLGAAAVGWIDVPSAPVEAVIALSIVLLAAEVVRQRQGTRTLTGRWPWGVAFGFGLLHGLGFAGALRSIGLPADAIPTALLGFNVGVEVGQLLFVGAGLGLWGLFQVIARRLSNAFEGGDALAPKTYETGDGLAPQAFEGGDALVSKMVGFVQIGVAYVVGSLAAFWTLRRVAAVLGMAGLLGVAGCDANTTSPGDAGRDDAGEADADTGLGEGATVEYTEERSPCRRRDPLRNAYFGDLHVHTSYSFDAYYWQTRNDPGDAYRFAKGEPLKLPPLNEDGEGTRTVRIDRPLDFAAVTDHAEYLGEVALCTDAESPVYDSGVCSSLRRDGGGASGFQKLSIELGFSEPERTTSLCGEGGRCRDRAASVWERVQAAADRAYDRTEACSFTTFHGYEYTNTRDGNNLHRNVLFRNGEVPDNVVSTFEEPEPVGLWRALRSSCLRAESDCDVITIPHNANLSSGAMFTRSYAGADSKSAERKVAELRARMEPLMEIYQHKGSMECTNGIDGVLGTPDEFCGFEKAYPSDAEDCDGETGRLGLFGQGCVAERNFYRNILAMGAAEKQRLGVDPFHLGVVGSTDTHSGTPGAVSEQDWKGHAGVNQSSPVKRLTGSEDYASNIPASRSPGGLTGVWAVENSRDAIFDALQRRETFATSGPRMTVRFFAGWDLPESMCEEPGFAETGYRNGQPMGSTLGTEGRSRSPVFAVLAQRDAGDEGLSRAPLQQIQIVEGTVPSDGEPSVEVHTVAGEPDNGASVDTSTCETSGSGFDTLCVTWRDPTFDPDARSFYYVRVLQNPTCRWSTYQCNALPESERPDSCEDPDVPDTIQERAWSSPIWLGERTERRDREDPRD